MRLSNLMLPDVVAAFSTDPTSVRELFNDLHAEDVADLIEAAEDDISAAMLLALDPERAADVLECIEEELQSALIARLGVEKAAPIVEAMASDERADMIGELEDELADAILARMDPEEAADVRTLVAYEDDTVGSVMSTEVLKVPLDMTVAEVIDRVRQYGEEAETVYYVYIVAAGDTLVGVISLRDLILHPPGTQVAELMTEDVKTIGPEADQEEVASTIQHYDLIALPVVDDNHHLIGIVTVDDVVDVLEEEATEDIHRIGAVQPLEASYFSTSFWTFVGKRAPWLVALFVGGILTAEALTWYEDEMNQAVLLIAFLPLIISSGGNSGSQSATLIIRALAVREVDISHAWRVLVREVGIGVVLGGMLAFIGAICAGLWSEPGEFYGLAATVGITLIAVVTIGTLAGSMLPILLERIGLDPAVSSTPFIASLVDMLGVVTYLSLAKAIMGLG